jgi:hypothetical protein
MMPTHLFVGLIISVLLAAGLTVAVASSFGATGFAWLLIPLSLALALRLWLGSQK